MGAALHHLEGHLPASVIQEVAFAGVGLLLQLEDDHLVGMAHAEGSLSLNSCRSFLSSAVAAAAMQKAAIIAADDNRVIGCMFLFLSCVWTIRQTVFGGDRHSFWRLG